ncbi:MAG TPA: iron-sulfur cluster assembly accessory protein [Gemmatimonadota bacterium]|nr:iron-sulfur cluster assembly accessory protein [Gemmatimonadota bacterium]
MNILSRATGNGDPPIVELTEEALERIRSALAAADPPGRCLRIRVTPGDQGFAYHLQSSTEDQVSAGDLRIERDGIVLVIDRGSADLLRGTRIHYRQTLLESGFHFDNPNVPASPPLPTGARTDLAGPLPDRVRMLLDTEINPAIAAHGGRVRLVDVRDGRVYLAFGGGCHGCGMVDVTLKQGIERRIREAVPEVVGVVDTTDHSAGENPYY